MAGIRRFTPDDVASVVALRQRAFAHSAHSCAADAEAYFHEIFFRSPWTDPELSSLVSEDAAGNIVGFLGIIPRRMQFQGQPIRVAVPTQIAVAPEHRGIAGVLLLKRLLAGPQDLTLSDVVNDTMRVLWERLGGTTLALHSLQWIHALAPVTFSAARIPGSVAWRVARRALRPLLRFGDAAATRARRREERHRPRGTALDPASLNGDAGAFTSGQLVGNYSGQDLAWLLAQTARKPDCSGLRVVSVDEEGARLGWYAYVPRRGEIADVVHVAAPTGKYASVLAHLVADARERGGLALRGRFEPRHVREWTEPAQVACDGPWVTAYSKRPELIAALHRPDAQLSRLDAEWWLNF
jgi:hypothetical protein